MVWTRTDRGGDRSIVEGGSVAGKCGVVDPVGKNTEQAVSSFGSDWRWSGFDYQRGGDDGEENGLLSSL